MSVTRIPIDGLWRCLCPSIDSIAVRQSSMRVASRIQGAHPYRTKPLLAQSFSCRARNTSSRTGNLVPHVDASRYPAHVSAKLFSSAASHSEVEDVGVPARTHSEDGLGLNVRIRRTRIPQKEVPILQAKENRDDLPISILHEQLYAYRTREGGFDLVTDLVEYLIKVRGEKPSLIHYDSLIRINADASKGSAVSVRSLLEEMKEEGIGPDSGAYHNALKVCLQNLILVGADC